MRESLVIKIIIIITIIIIIIIIIIMKTLLIFLNMRVHTIENLTLQVSNNWLLEITNILFYYNTITNNSIYLQAIHVEHLKFH